MFKTLSAFTLGVICATALSVLATPGDFALQGISTFANTGLHILDTGGDHDLIIVPGTDLGADRQLTFTTGDAARTVTLEGNPTLDGQDLTADSTTVQFNSLTVNTSMTGVTGTDLPATCAAGEQFLDTNDDSCADANDGSGCLCVCIATNTWAAAT